MFFPQIQALQHKLQGLLGKVVLAALLVLILAGSLIACVVVLCCAAYSAMAAQLGRTYALLLMGLGLLVIASAGALALLLWLRPAKHPAPAAEDAREPESAPQLNLPPLLLPIGALAAGVLLGTSRWFRAQVMAQATSPLGLLVLRELSPHVISLITGAQARAESEQGPSAHN